MKRSVGGGDGFGEKNATSQDERHKTNKSKIKEMKVMMGKRCVWEEKKKYNEASFFLPRKQPEIDIMKSSDHRHLQHSVSSHTKSHRKAHT